MHISALSDSQNLLRLQAQSTLEAGQAAKDGCAAEAIQLVMMSMQLCTVGLLKSNTVRPIQ